jgi:hypothetical protein
MKGGSSRIAPVVAVLAVLLLVGIVAVAATGSTSVGTGEGRRPSEILLDTFFTLVLLMFIPAAAIFVYGLTQRKDIAREMASGRYRRTGIGTFLVFLLVFSAVVYFRVEGWNPVFGGQGPGGVFGRDGAAEPPDVAPAVESYRAEFTWIPVVIVLALAAAGIVAYVLASRRRRDLAVAEERVADDVADMLEDSLDDLRAEPDARRAVIAAYARLEQALAAAGLPRHRPETAEEYVARILDRLEVAGPPVRTLTDLFTTAKFSHHDVDGAMKEAAIAALEEIRDELREAARRKRQELVEAATAHGEAVAS